MSLFDMVDVECPLCAEVTTIELVHSVNADRRPDLRQAILDDTFQTISCPACTDSFRIEPEFTLLGVELGEYLSVWPSTALTKWGEIEQRSRAAFDSAYGPQAPRIAAAIGRELRPRVVFGWEATREKLLARNLDIDDRAMELAKLAIFRMHTELPIGIDGALRLRGLDEAQNLVFHLFETGLATPTQELRVPRALLDEIDADPEWQPLHAQLSAGPFVDMLRLLVPTRSDSAKAA